MVDLSLNRTLTGDRCRSFRKMWKQFYKTMHAEFEGMKMVRNGHISCSYMKRRCRGGGVGVCPFEGKPTCDASHCSNPYHICKHLIRLYCSEDGMRSNKPPMPSYGEVYRQSTFPVLWVKGIHSPEQLVETDLCPDNRLAPIAHPDIAMGTANALDEEVVDEEIRIREDGQEDDEEFYEDLEQDHNPDLNGDGFGNFDSDDLTRRQDEALRIESELEESILAEQREHQQQERELEDEGDRIKERLQEAIEKTELLKCQLEDALRYPAGHPHLREIPGLGNGTVNLKTLASWVERRHGLASSVGIVNTWSS